MSPTCDDQPTPGGGTEPPATLHASVMARVAAAARRGQRSMMRELSLAAALIPGFRAEILALGAEVVIRDPGGRALLASGQGEVTGNPDQDRIGGARVVEGHRPGSSGDGERVGGRAAPGSYPEQSHRDDLAVQTRLGGPFCHRLAGHGRRTVPAAVRST